MSNNLPLLPEGLHRPSIDTHRTMSQRGVAFSGKKKKQQLKEKKAKKKEEKETAFLNESDEKKKKMSSSQRDEDEDELAEKSESNEEGGRKNQDRQQQQQQRRNKKPVPEKRDLKTVFELETREEVEMRKQEAHKPLNIEKRSQPWSILKEFIDESFIDIPKRPKESFTTKEKLKIEQIERKAFNQWLDNIYQSFPKERLNYFEHNLEVWRQLWRVCERSHIIMLITDARFPLFHFPPALYNYIVKELKKPLFLVFNKKDLVDERTLLSWTDYFHRHFPELKIVHFNAFNATATSSGGPLEEDKKRKLSKKKYETAEGIQELISVVKAFAKRELSIGNLGKKTEKETTTNHSDDDGDSEDDESEESRSESESGSEDKSDAEEEEEKKEDSNAIYLGLVGHPNVGKSSLINGLFGKKVVSASRTPGHTKHFQTLYLTKELVVVDCPGLVFPALDRPKALQILCGLFPIAQVREPYSPIRYLAERLPLEKIYGLKLPHDAKGWTPFLIAESLAEKLGYRSARSGRPDTHRAGLQILYDCIDGKIPISWPPPDTQPSPSSDTHPPSAQTPPSTSKPIELSSQSDKKLKKKEKKKKLLQPTESEDDEEEDDEEEEEEEQKVKKPASFQVLKKKNEEESSEEDEEEKIPNKSSQKSNPLPKKKKKKNRKGDQALDWKEKLQEKERRGKSNSHQ